MKDTMRCAYCGVERGLEHYEKRKEDTENSIHPIAVIEDTDKKCSSFVHRLRTDINKHRLSSKEARELALGFIETRKAE